MDEQSLNMLLRIAGFAGIVALLFFFFRKKKPVAPKTDPVLEAKIQELKIQGMSEENARLQATAEYQAVMKARQKKVSIIMGLVWMGFGVMFYFINGLDISSVALIGLGGIQIVTGLLIKTDQ